MRKREDSVTTLLLRKRVVPPARGPSLRSKQRSAFRILTQAKQSACSHAEAGGFEPPIPLRVYRISSAAHSATLARFLTRIVAREDFTIVNQKPAFYKGILNQRKRAPEKREPDVAIATQTFFSQENQILCQGRCAQECPWHREGIRPHSTRKVGCE